MAARRLDRRCVAARPAELPEVALLDYKLPELDGIAIIHAIAHHNDASAESTPVLEALRAAHAAVRPVMRD